MSDRQAVVLSYLNNTRAMIAALKAQRWDIFKWTVGINLALATASEAYPNFDPRYFAGWMTVAAVGLLGFYHLRITQVRKEGLPLLKEPMISDIETLLGNKSYGECPILYDWKELLALAAIMALSFAIPFGLVR